MSLEDVILIFGLPRSICKDGQKKKANPPTHLLSIL
jgi:hypothetical protein